MHGLWNNLVEMGHRSISTYFDYNMGKSDIQQFIVAQGMCNATINVYTSNPNYAARRYILVANI